MSQKNNQILINKNSNYEKLKFTFAIIDLYFNSNT